MASRARQQKNYERRHPVAEKINIDVQDLLALFASGPIEEILTPVGIARLEKFMLVREAKKETDELRAELDALKADQSNGDGDPDALKDTSPVATGANA